jgi:pteridine reductase
LNQTKVALVTGAARRIGASITKHLHQAGYKVIIHYHKSAQEAQALVTSLNRQRPYSAYSIQQDLADSKAAVNIINETLQWGGRLDVLINNASQFTQTPITEAMDAWDSLYLINVKAPFLLSQSAYTWLAMHEGVIINITDIHASKPLKNYAVYCQTKAALSMQTLALAKEFAPLVRVNAIAPGAIAWPELENSITEKIQEKIIAQTLLKRHGNPEYIAQAVLALVENNFITGQVLMVDGGRSVN